MREDLIREMYVQEQSYWWHVGKRVIVNRIIEDRNLSSGSKILVLGCGTGLFISELQKKGYTVYGMDFSLTCLSFCKERHIENLFQSDLEFSIPILSEKLDMVICLDVLEHLNNEIIVISEITRVLKKNGTAIFTVPAYQSFWSRWDIALGHKRRYNHKSLSSLLSSNEKIEILKLSHFNMLILPLVFLFRKFKELFLNKKDYSSDFIKLPLFINRFLIYLLNLESYLMGKTTLKFGLSILFVLKKK